MLKTTVATQLWWRHFTLLVIARLPFISFYVLYMRLPNSQQQLTDQELQLLTDTEQDGIQDIRLNVYTI